MFSTCDSHKFNLAVILYSAANGYCTEVDPKPGGEMGGHG